MAKGSRTVEFGNIWEDGATPSAAHERWGNHWMAWSFWVFTLEDASRIIGEQAFHNELKKGHVVMPSVLAVRAMLLGYAIECAMKCYWLKRGNKIVKNGKFVGVPGAGDGHNLVQLSRIVGFSPTARETAVLARLAKFIRFAGRYPIAKLPDEMAPLLTADLEKVDVGFLSKAEFRTCLSILNKLMSMISGKTRRTFQPLGTRHYLTRG
jgi:hypothetical protein